MSIASLIRGMAAAGASPEAIAIAVEAIEAAQNVIAEKRAVERDRKRAQRERNRISEDVDGTVTGQSRDTDGTVTDASLSLDKSPPDPQKLNPIPHVCVSRAREAGPFPRPEGVDPDDWRDFLANRQRKRLPNTAAAHRKLLRDLERWADDEWPPPKLIAFAAERGWAAIFDPRDKIDGRRTGTHTVAGNQSAGIGRTAAAALSVIERLDRNAAARQVAGTA